MRKVGVGSVVKHYAARLVGTMVNARITAVDEEKVTLACSHFARKWTEKVAVATRFFMPGTHEPARVEPVWS